jgi:hypothetical protein
MSNFPDSNDLMLVVIESFRVNFSRSKLLVSYNCSPESKVCGINVIA